MIAQLIRFGGVGGLVTLVHVLVALAAERTLPVSAQQANLMGYAVAFVLSYIGHARFTFRAPVRSMPQVLRFFFLSLVGLAASSLTVWVVTTVIGSSFTVAMAAVVVIVPLVSYLAMRFWVFAAQNDTHTP